MIWDSVPWKRELTRRATALRRRMHQRRWGPPSLAKLETDVFFTAYAIRKLIEAKKVSAEIEALRIRARAHDLVKGPVDHWNWHRIDEHFDLGSSARVDLTLLSFCNQLIHSFVFIAVTSDEGLDGFFVASDYERRRQLLHFAVPDVIHAIEAVAQDDVVYIRSEMDPSTRERVIVRKSNASPESVMPPVG